MSTQIDRIFNVLISNDRTPGITPKTLAKKAKVPVSTVYKRIADLREEGLPIYLNVRNVKGKAQSFYRLAA